MQKCSDPNNFSNNIIVMMCEDAGPAPKVKYTMGNI